MVTRYTAKQIADDVAAGMDPDVELVSATDYDAMFAERDELKRRLNSITYKLGNSPIPDSDAWRKWYQRIYATIISIAEGRDNG